jgi:hypothetical protein
MFPCPELLISVNDLAVVGKTSPEKPFHVFGYSLPECPPDWLAVLPWRPLSACHVPETTMKGRSREA